MKKALSLNMDIGERGSKHPIDKQLFKYLDIANIACGGHSGDRDSVQYYVQLAKKHNVTPTMHLSYPDKENFGRKKINISWNELEKSLDEQRSLMPFSKAIKFHGALYHDILYDKTLIKNILLWLRKNGIKTIITMASTPFSKTIKKDFQVIEEFFLERAYVYENKVLALMNRKEKEASITNLARALEQAKLFITQKRVLAKVKANWQAKFVQAQSFCIHSDSLIALELAKKIHSLIH